MSTIRRFRDSLARTINAWDSFEAGEIGYLDIHNIPELSEHWDTSYFANIRSDISELRYLHLLLSQKLELFNSLRDGLVNASALKESAVATKQGDAIKSLTIITVVRSAFSFSLSKHLGPNEKFTVLLTHVARDCK